MINFTKPKIFLKSSLKAILFFFLPLLTATVLQPSASYAETDIEFIIDVSGSMEKQLDGEQQMISARRALLRALDTIPGKELVAVRAYGHRVDKSKKEESCKDTELLIPFKESDKGAIQNAINGLTPKGYTPIALALQKARDDLFDVGVGRESERVIILLTDGEETCGGDPLAVLKKLKEEGFDVTIYSVGFNVNAVARKQLEDIAAFTGGAYFDAKNAEQLDDALTQATAKSMVLNKEKKTYGDQTRGGDSYESASEIAFDKEWRLDHHQKKDFYDYFYFDAKAGEEINVVLKSLEKGINIDGNGKVSESSRPYSGFEIHDDSRTKVVGKDLIGKRFATVNTTFYPKKDGRYYFLFGSTYAAINKDQLTFSLGRKSFGDLGTKDDAGSTINSARDVSIQRYRGNHLGGADLTDVFKFKGTPGEKYFIGVIPEEEFPSIYEVKVFDDFKQVLATGRSSRNQGLKMKWFEVPEEATYFIELKTPYDKKSLPYTLVLRKKEIKEEITE